MFFRLSFPEDSSSLMPEMISNVYRALRSINPSPYLSYFDFGGYRIFGSSPETHCKIEDGRATSTRLPEQPAVPEIR